jgi:hypothetical protein
MFSPEAILEKIQKYHHNKAKEKIRQRNEKGWMKINKEIIDYWEYKQNKEFVPSYIEKNEEEIEQVKKLHLKLSKSENPLEGWNWIKERFVRKLHESLFKSNKDYRIKAKIAIFRGLPFCPFKRDVVWWITTEYEINDPMQGLCLFCFLRGIYHKLLSVKGTELWEKDVFTKNLGIKISKKQKREFYKDDGKTRKEQKKRMEALATSLTKFYEMGI